MDNTENSDLRVAQVETLNFEALRDGDNIEATRLFDACCKDGFFYLDMSGTESNIQTAINDMYELEQQLFDLPERELMQYDIDKLSPKKLNG